MYCLLIECIRQAVYDLAMGRSNRSPDLSRLFAALADSTRLRLLNLMDGREVCVCYFVAILRQSQPKISRHLAYLRSAGIVAARRDGKWMHYRISEPLESGTSRILRETIEVLKTERRMQADRERLQTICCNPAQLTSIRSAPPSPSLIGGIAQGSR